MATQANFDDALKSDTPPTDSEILSLVWLGIKSIKSDTTSLRTDVDALDIRTKAIEEANLERDDDLQSLQNTVQMMQARLVRSEIHQKHLSEEIEDIKSRSMRDNIIFNFDQAATDFKESRGENCLELIHSFLSAIMGLRSKIYI